MNLLDHPTLLSATNMLVIFHVGVRPIKHKQAEVMFYVSEMLTPQFSEKELAAADWELERLSKNKLAEVCLQKDRKLVSARTQMIVNSIGTIVQGISNEDF